MAGTRESVSKLLRGKKMNSEDLHQIQTPGAEAPDEPKISKVRQAPVLDDEERRLAKAKEEARRKSMGARSTVLTESTSLG